MKEKAPEYAKYTERNIPHDPAEALRKKAWHGTQLFSNCEIFPDHYTSKEENN